MNTNEPLDVLARASLDRIANAAKVILDVPLVLISMFDATREGYIGSNVLAGLRTDEPSPLCREVATRGKPIMMQDARRRLPKSARTVSGIELVAYAGVALSMRDPSRIGAIAALAPTRRAWQSQDLQILRSLADAASAIVDMHAGCAEITLEERRGAKDEIAAAKAKGKRRTLELEATSIHDELTGLLNRRGLFAVARTQLDAIQRHSIGGLLLYLDLDGLKGTNDHHGHSAGDELLRSAANVLRASFNDTDTIARLGGDEFVVITTDTPAHEHPAILARLAAELGRVNLTRDPKAPLAWSMGLVPIEPSTLGSLDELMSAADRRMYAAKRTLRDLVIPRHTTAG